MNMLFYRMATLHGHTRFMEGKTEIWGTWRWGGEIHLLMFSGIWWVQVISHQCPARAVSQSQEWTFVSCFPASLFPALTQRGADGGVGADSYCLVRTRKPMQINLNRSLFCSLFCLYWLHLQADPSLRVARCPPPAANRRLTSSATPMKKSSALARVQGVLAPIGLYRVTWPSLSLSLGPRNGMCWLARSGTGNRCVLLGWLAGTPGRENWDVITRRRQGGCWVRLRKTDVTSPLHSVSPAATQDRLLLPCHCPGSTSSVSLYLFSNVQKKQADAHAGRVKWPGWLPEIPGPPFLPLPRGAKMCHLRASMSKIIQKPFAKHKDSLSAKSHSALDWYLFLPSQESQLEFYLQLTWSLSSHSPGSQ